MSVPDPITRPNLGCGDRHLVARFAMWLIRRWYKQKDPTLAQRLHLLGAEFDPHPGEPWTPPDDWWSDPNDIGRDRNLASADEVTLGAKARRCQANDDNGDRCERPDCHRGAHRTGKRNWLARGRSFVPGRQR